MSQTEAVAGLAERYRRFAAYEARGSSPLYEALANRVADSPSILRFLSDIPTALQQPNLFLAALRLVAGTPAGPYELEATVERHAADIAQVMRTRRTQTNEPGRCAALLPVLSRFDGPIALIEVGTSAGLCLLPDKYGYDYGRARLDPPPETRGIAPVLRCEAGDDVPLPDRHPVIAWRAGLDLNPLRVDSAEDMVWLETLVWPEQHDRLARLRGAIEVARNTDLRVTRGDLRTDLAALAATAPRDATLVVFHTAVLAYVQAQADRDAFARNCGELGATWISNEGPEVFPWIAAKTAPARARGMFLIAVDGTPVAWTRPHGQWLEWI